MGCGYAAIQIEVILRDLSAYVDRLEVLVVKTVALLDHLRYTDNSRNVYSLCIVLHLGEGEGNGGKENIWPQFFYLTYVFKLCFTSAY